jgi:hypothetical protein
MAKPARKNLRKKPRGRPAGRRYSGTIPVRLEPETIAAIDRWTAGHELTRSEAIRRLVEIGLAAARRAGLRRNKASKASEMAGEEIDRLPADPAVSNEERQLRKQRLLKGPREFREFRDRRERRKPKG